MNKKGFGLAWEFIFDIFIFLIVIFSLMFFVNSAISGRLIEKQIMAKEICYMTMNADNNSKIIVESKMLIERKDKNIVVKEFSFDPGYEYPCYLTDKINFERKINQTIISIQK